MKASWATATLDDVLVEIRNGLNCKQSKEGTGDPISRIETIATGEFNFKKVGRSDLTETQRNKFRLVDGDILFSHINSPPHIGKSALLRGNDPIYHGVNLLLFRPTGQVDAGYLQKYLTSLYSNGYWRSRCKQSVNQASLNQTDIKRVPIPVPPLEEQRRIVSVLDEAFDGLARARAHAEANLKNARELFESFLGAVFTTGAKETRPLQDLVEADCSLSYGIVQPGDEFAAGLPIVRPTDLGDRIISLEGLKLIDPARAKGYARTKLKGTEILLCVRGSTGVVSMASDELAGANVTRGIVPIRFDPAVVEQRFGYFQFLAKYIQDQIRARTYGAALMQINIRDLRQLSFIVSPMDQQIALVERLESVSADFNRLLQGYEQKLSEIDGLRQSLLHEAFMGELT